MGPNLFANYGEAVSAILFCIGFTNLLLQTNLIKKIIGLNIMDSAIYLFLAEKGYIAGRVAPIVADGGTTTAEKGGKIICLLSVIFPFSPSF